MFNDRVSLLAVEGGTTVRYCGFPHPSIQQQWARRSRFHTHANCRKVWMRKLVLHERTTTAQVRSWPAFGQPLARVVLRPLVARGAATPTGTKVDGIQTAFRCHRPLSHRFHRQHQRHNSSSRRRWSPVEIAAVTLQTPRIQLTGAEEGRGETERINERTSERETKRERARETETVVSRFRPLPVIVVRWNKARSTVHSAGLWENRNCVFLPFETTALLRLVPTRMRPHPSIETPR